MRVFVDADPRLSFGIGRVARALARYVPKGVTVVHDPNAADLRVWHVISETWDELQKTTQPYALMQYCWRTTSRPDPADWMPLWQNAKAVWSYYRLPMDGQPNFYFAPLGVDTRAFMPGTKGKWYLVGTSGHVAYSEYVGEWAQVVRAVGAQQFHLGPQIIDGIQAKNGIHDVELASYWSRCEFISGLRSIEGFELPAYEGLACGARPVMFDREDAWDWMGDHAIYVKEDPATLVDQLKMVVSDRRPVRQEEIAWVRETFDWKKLVSAFWERCL